MPTEVCNILLTRAPLEAPPLANLTEAGAIIDFWGVVRLHEAGAEIAGLEYEAHAAMAEYQLRSLASEAAARFQVTETLIHHRIGFVGVGEPSLLVRVASRHRAAAFEAGQWVVDELKKRVPIWKHPRQERPGDSLPRADSAVTGAL
ncbi:MAG: molybdenum cofactor biosynthesis protein MoaE [Verrucomicrobiota bacterium]|nr:molybdenum cofactor biosynthesis protein MoaE [Verrucomicrobiota bacterium]